ncbi:MAG TPA: hypothetical protein PLE45_05775 [Spirochaetota bacterium]|nr:hypothetical protein [Spirochaetota bacterium]HOL56790.1 hypothetical protein [Spirochaetota bacterium]HPP04257.1 hypothetical protein [Spirochaetota bacterium]
MNIALINIGNNKLLIESSKIFAKDLYEKGNIVKETNGILDTPRVTGFQYLIFFIDAGKFLGKNYYEELNQFFENVGVITARYASVYTQKRMFSDRVLYRYMAKLESEGLIIHDSGIIDSLKNAEEIVKRLKPVKPNE